MSEKPMPCDTRIEKFPPLYEVMPCPFCGGEAEIVGGPENWTPTFYDPDSGGDPIAIVCKTCACGLHFFDGYAEAIAAWNRRAQEVNGETSDGYHTFNELYHHRAVLFSVICNDRPTLAWKSKFHHDGTMYDGMFIVGIETPDGQATYHYDIEPYWEMFTVQELPQAPEWDGHTPAQAIERIGKLRTQPENEPLTLSELYDIDNEPLYFHCTVGAWRVNGWHIVKPINYDGAQFKDVRLDNNDAHIESLYNYGITWLAYRQKPERSEG